MVHTAVAQAYKDAQVKEYQVYCGHRRRYHDYMQRIERANVPHVGYENGDQLPAHLPAAASMQKHYRADQIGGINVQVIVGENCYEVTKPAAKAIMREAKNAASHGTVYAIQKGKFITLVNHKGDGRYFRENGFKTYRKREVYGGHHHR